MESYGAALAWRTEIWVKHYSSSHQILLVGEGDFSFSLSLALGFRSAFNIVATSLDSYDTLMEKYGRAYSNLLNLRALGATILYEVNATQMKHHYQLYGRKFDRIVFNFPHAGFYGKEDDPKLIKKHRDIVHGFLSNARWLLQNYGEIHISHKNSAPYCQWNLEELARENSLFLVESVPFYIADYPYYQNKRGDGLSSDEPFSLGECSTYKFAAYAYSPLSSFLEPAVNILSCQNSVAFKFIVKGSVRAVHRGGEAAYAGALVNPENTVIAVVFGPLYYRVDSDIAELLAVKEALLMFERSILCGKMGLVVESDSRSVITWIKSDMGNPWHLLPVINGIKMDIGRIRNVDVRYSYREFGSGINHSLNDSLVELGFDMNSPLEFWYC